MSRVNTFTPYTAPSLRFGTDKTITREALRQAVQKISDLVYSEAFKSSQTSYAFEDPDSQLKGEFLQNARPDKPSFNITDKGSLEIAEGTYRIDLVGLIMLEDPEGSRQGFRTVMSAEEKAMILAIAAALPDRT